MKKTKIIRNVLHVTHCWGGGIPVYISDIKEALQGDFNVFVLKCSDGKVQLEYGLGSKEIVYYHLPKPLAMTETSNTEYRKVVRLILKAYEIDLIHINITLGHTFDIFKTSKKLNLPVIYTVHDFFYICPTYHLIDSDGVYCTGCEYGNENDECLKNHPYINNPGFDGKMLKKWRSEFIKVKDIVDYYIFPSVSCKKIFSSFYGVGENKCKIIYHGTSFKKKKLLRKERDEYLRVGILGSMLKHKGEALFKYILENVNDDKVKFYHYGEGFLENSKLVNYGAYERANILKMLKKDQIDIILLLSTWPETFSYTLTESIAAGIPPIVTNLGALRERVEQGGIGWVVDYKDPEKICELIRNVQVNRAEIDDRSERIKEFPLKTVSAMKKKTLSVYKSALSANTTHKLGAYVVARARHELEKRVYKPVGGTDGDGAKMGPLEIFMKSMTGMSTVPRSFLDRVEPDSAGFIDYIKVENGSLIVEGWSLISTDKPVAPPVKLYLVCDDKFIAETKDFVVDRPDVPRALNLKVDSLCGFKFIVPEKFVTDLDLIECFAESSNGHLYQLDKSGNLPCWLQLELTGRCNLRCPQCPSTMYSGFHQQDLNSDDLQIVKPLLNKVNSLCFDGFGEVLLAKVLKEALSQVPISIKSFEFHTNGMLLDEKWELLLMNAPPLHRVIVSIDSLKEPVYNVLRKGGNLKNVLNNMFGFLKRRRELGQNYPKVIPNMTIMRDNYQEMSAFIDLAVELDQMAEFIFLYDTPKLGGDTDERFNNFDYEDQRPANFADALNCELIKVMEYAKNKGVTIRFSGSMIDLPQISPDKNNYIGQRKPISECIAATAGHCLQADGKFMLCVWQTSPIFNWRETRNVDPLKDERGRKVIEMIKTGIIPRECSGAACEYVGREQSSENYSPSCLFTSGGWQM